MNFTTGIVLPTTLALAAAAAITNLWLSIRIGALRQKHKVSVGDGGNEAIQRRMRAQLNFAENTFLVLVLVAAIELSGHGGWWLPLVALAYAVGRILHGLGMDGGKLQWGRMVGTLVTMLTLVGLAGVAAWLAFQYS
ncbi:MAPEG family protein [Alteriqipengyuania sp. WL0013]|uniref:MAPEG family protein n=1 Tax=Alteriqipengyuania sp. WL0013 TaxID=3110773 RepID=UPI002CAFED65|nr:MAPEG family protein [Alteriqipengyuania sp. WL0013]MEB3415380.1 MAPEG family protein [Alteriqipengyuania sp. WL0013]